MGVLKRLLWIGVLFTAAISYSQTLPADIEAAKPARIEILISASTNASLESMFGHSSILVIPEGTTWEQGLVFSFLAVTKPGRAIKYYYDGLSGKFPFQLAVVPAYRFFYEKVFEEQRSVQRLIIPTTEKQKTDLWNHLLELHRHPEKIGDYYFVRYNCATAVLAALKNSGIQVNQKQIVFSSPLKGVRPKEMPSMLRKALLTPYPEQFVPSVQVMLSELERKYSIETGSVYDEKSDRFLPWRKVTLLVLPKLETDELLILSQSLSPIDRTRSSVIESILASRPRARVPLIRFSATPDTFYTACYTQECAKAVVKEMAAIYPKNYLSKMLRSNRMQQAETLVSFKPEINYQTSPQIKHWQLLNVELVRELSSKKPLGLIFK